MTASLPVLLSLAGWLLAGGEIGTNDLRISTMGPPGDGGCDAVHPSATFNPTHNEYVVVWEGNDAAPGMAHAEVEIYGRRLSGTSGALLGSSHERISLAGGTGDATYDVYDPDVAYDNASFQYLVVWSGESDAPGLASGEAEIWGQITDRWLNRLGASFRISFMGPDGTTAYGGFGPAVAFNPFRQEYLVVWYGDHNSGGLVDNELEVFGQRVSSIGTLIGSAFRISDMGPNGDAAYDAFTPDVVFNTTEREFLVVWTGDDDTGSFVNDEYEIYAQRLTELGGELGGDYRLSTMGGVANTLYGGYSPAVAYNGTDNQYLVVWQGDDTVGGLVNNEYEVFGQRLNYWLGGLGADDFRISDAGGTGDATYQVMWGPDVAYNPAAHAYLVTWSGEDTVDGMVNGEWEVFSQALTWDGLEVGINDERISDAGGLGNSLTFVYAPVVAANSVDGQYLVAWEGGDTVGGMVPGEYEIFGQRMMGLVFADGFESGGTAAWGL